MKYKKSIIIIILAIFLFSISSVAAGDVSDTSIASDDANDITEKANDEIIESAQDGDALGEPTGTFTDLQQRISEADANATITLDRDYAYDEGFSKEGIQITKTLTINGNNHILDAKSKSRIFKIENVDNIILKNIVFVGGNAPTGDGGAIYNFWGENFQIISCKFMNCYARSWGGAIRNTVMESQLISCEFINCTSNDMGGAVEMGCLGNGIYNIESCTFNGCSALRGGALDIDDTKSCKITSCDFTGCSATNYDGGGAIYARNVENFDLSSCTFNNCSAKLRGGAIHCYLYGIKNTTIRSSNFTDCRVERYGGAVFGELNSRDPMYVISCNFVNCHSQTNVTSKDALYNDSCIIIAQDCTYKDVNPVLIPVKIVAPAVSTVYNGGKYLVATLKDENGNPINDAKVTVVLGGKTYNLPTDKNGQVKVSTNGLKPNAKAYAASITFPGNAKYDKSSAKASVVVKKANVKLAAKAKAFKRTDKTKAYSITLKDNLNKPMNKVKVYLTVAKKTYAAVTTKGIATFKLTKLTKKGTYVANFIYKGNAYYNKLTKNIKIVVK